MAMPSCLRGTDLAVWRGASGQAFVWGDRCPHRGMRLSQGFVRQDRLSCIYHGWQYGADGSCVSIPAHPDLVPPKTICATTYPAAEAGGIIWTSLKPQSGAPPGASSPIPVRSLQIDVPVHVVAAHFGEQSAMIFDLHMPAAVTLALQPVSDDCTALHALTGKTQDRKTVSRWLEDQRTQIERTAA